MQAYKINSDGERCSHSHQLGHPTLGNELSHWKPCYRIKGGVLAIETTFSSPSISQASPTYVLTCLGQVYDHVIAFPLLPFLPSSPHSQLPLVLKNFLQVYTLTSLFGSQWMPRLVWVQGYESAIDHRPGGWASWNVEGPRVENKWTSFIPVGFWLFSKPAVQQGTSPEATVSGSFRQHEH